MLEKYKNLPPKECMEKSMKCIKEHHPDWPLDKMRAVALKNCGLSRSRSYEPTYDYNGIAAIGDVQYDDGFDPMDEIINAFKKYEKIPIVRDHNEETPIGFTKHWELDKCNKKVYIGFNQDDVSVELGPVGTILGTSIEYQLNEEGHIIGVNHIAIGDSFKPKCNKEVCHVIRNRGDPIVGQDKTVEEPEAPTTKEVTEKSEIELLKEQISLMKKELEGLKKPPVEEPSKPQEDVKLEPKEDVQHDLKGEEVKPMFNRGINIKNISQNG